jgi:hypothetical protein
MRPRIGGLVLFASALAWIGSAASGCNTAGVSYVYMAIDGAGTQHRQTFYTDSSAIYCIAKFSSARADATLDFTIRQTATFPWCSYLAKGQERLQDSTDPAGDIFAVGEQVPGVSDEAVVSEEILPIGMSPAVPCAGYFVPNQLPAGVCDQGGAGTAAGGLEGACEVGDIPQGANSAGSGYTCCVSTLASTTTSSPSILPYPPGVYTCTVSLDGVVAGVTNFTIEFPGYPLSTCPSMTLEVNKTPVTCYCPTAPPVTGVSCYNWVPLNAACPGEDPTTVCTCTEMGWVCP